MGSAQLTAGLTASYARWRSSRLGEITDTLEQQLLFELAGPIAGKRLLDVGCGDAALASEFARRGAVVTGLDADPLMVAAARQRTKIEGTQLHLVEGQAERLPFKNAEFDLVLAVTTLCFVRDRQTSGYGNDARSEAREDGLSSANSGAGAFGQHTAVSEAGLVIRPGAWPCFARHWNFVGSWLPPGST